MYARRDTIIMDLDNTLWDWVDFWYREFVIKLDGIKEATGLSDERICAEIREVHQARGTSEYSLLFEELPCLKKEFGSTEAIQKGMEATIKAFRRERKIALKMYPGVGDFLHEMKAMGCTLVAFTESQSFYTFSRFRRLALDGVIDFLYTTEDEVSVDANISDRRKYQSDYYKFKITEARTTPKGEVKPNPHILLSIIEEVGSAPDDCVYIGDNLHKDIPMAKEAGVLDAYAAYGGAHHTAAYQWLRKVSHWPDVTVEKDKIAHEEKDEEPTIVLKNGIQDIKSFVELEGSFSRKYLAEDK